MKFDFGGLVSKDRTKNERVTGALRDGYAPCILCGRAVADNNPRAFDVMVTGGGFVVTTEEDVQNPGWLGIQAIGSDCAAKHPELKPYYLKRDLRRIIQKTT